MTKTKIIDRLLYNGNITPDEAEVLRKEENLFASTDYKITLSPDTTDESIQIYDYLDSEEYKKYFESDEYRDFLKLQESIKPLTSGNEWYDNCSCNPRNGGSGICQCVNPYNSITCSVNDSLVGQTRVMGGAGPVYVVSKISGDYAEILFPENGEKVRVLVSSVLNDPLDF